MHLSSFAWTSTSGLYVLKLKCYRKNYTEEWKRQFSVYQFLFLFFSLLSVSFNCFFLLADGIYSFASYIKHLCIQLIFFRFILCFYRQLSVFICHVNNNICTHKLQAYSPRVKEIGMRKRNTKEISLNSAVSLHVISCSQFFVHYQWKS